MKSLSFITTALIISTTLIGCSSKPKKKKPAPPQVSVASMKSVTLKKLTGKITFEQKSEGLLMLAHVSGLKPNSSFGFHIHESGKCEGPDYKSAGEHLNPYQHDHNSPAKDDRHLGDLGNLTTDKTGHAMKEFVISPSAQDMSKIIGKSVIIHAKSDDFKTQPSGNSGGRIACGLIEVVK